MHFIQSGEGPAPQRPDYAQLVEEFPGPVAIACAAPDESIALCGYERSDDHPWALQVTYAASGRNLLRVRTVRGTLDWTPVIRTVEDLATSVYGFDGSRELAEAAKAAVETETVTETPTVMQVDGVSVAGTRIDIPGRSGVRLAWNDQHVFCIGDPDQIDAVELRTATGADFTRITADFEEYVARRRARG